MAVLDWTRRHSLIRRAAVLIGARAAYRAVREFLLVSRHGRSKAVTVRGRQILYPLIDDATCNFYLHPYWFGELYETGVTLHMAERMPSARCFVDVGANVGFYSTMAGVLGAKEVHAVEMDRDNARRIRAAAALNGLENVTVHEVALGDRDGQVDYYCCGYATNTLEVGPTLRTSFPKHSVPMMALDRLVSEYKLDPDLIKIDVEGAEYLVLSGMSRLLARPSLKVYCEVHLHQGRGSLKAFGHTLGDVVSVFHSHGFALRQLRLRSDNSTAESTVASPDDIDPNVSVMLYAEK